MAFSRAVVPAEPAGDSVLTSDMAGIGMNFAVRPSRDPNIEDTLVFASIEGMERRDLRVLAILTAWFGIHAAWVNADRLIRLVALQESRRVRALWSALARMQAKDRRFTRLVQLYTGPRQDVIETGTDFQVNRYGEDPRFQGSRIRVAANALRERAADVLQPAELARRHRVYRWRVIMGPSYRADMWGALEADPALSPAALARKTYGSFATAWRVHRDFDLVH